MAAKTPPFVPSELLRAQNDFFLNLISWRQAMYSAHPDWIIKGTDYGVLRNRKIRRANGREEVALDRVHILASHHYDALAVDASVFVPAPEAGPGRYRIVDRSDAPEWAEAHEVWLGIDPLNRVMPKRSNDAGHLARAVNEADKRI